MASTSSPGADVDVVIDPVIDPENAPSTTVLEAKLAIGMLGLYCARPDPDSISMCASPTCLEVPSGSTMMTQPRAPHGRSQYSREELLALLTT